MAFLRKFIKRRIVIILSLIILLTYTGCTKKDNITYDITLQEGYGVYPSLENKKRVINLYKDYITNLGKFPITFTYGNKTYRGFGKDFKEVSRKAEKEDDRVNHTIVLIFKKTIKVTLIARVYPDYCAYEWTVYFENTGDKDTKVFKDIFVADMVFEGEKPILKGIYGDGGVDDGPYSPYSMDLRKVNKVEFTPMTGRSTYNHFPYFNLEYGEGGTFIAMGWPIMWKADFTYEDNKVHFLGSQKELETYLKPGEKIRTPLIAFLDYEGRDELKNMNLWRHWFIDCNMRKIEDKLFEPVISGGTSWVYNEMVNATEENQISAMTAYVDNNIPISYWWMDAGWYFKTGDESLTTWLDTGTWMVDTKRFPTEFKAISDYGKTVGVKTLLWFEPEVVRLDWSLSDKENGIPKEYMLNDILVDFGNEDFINWYFDRASSIIDKGGISLYRQDYGINPAPIFSAVNTKDRIGIRENLYAQGYYKYWDMLIERYPNMMIDSCAAGGGRNDIESMRRSLPLHKTDHDYSNFTDKQAMHQSLFAWLPYFGTPVTGPDRCNKADEYELQSAYVPWVALGYNINNKRLEWDIIKKCTDEWMQIKDYFYCDYYPITNWSRKNTDMRGWQFIDPNLQRGYFQLFRPERCEESRINVKLHGLVEENIYSLVDTKGNLIVKETGQVLMEKGITVELEKRRSSIVVLINSKGENN